MPESQNTEYKRSWREEYMKWICGFANAEGGVLHIGRDDAGRVVGLPDAQRLLEEIPNKVRDLLSKHASEPQNPNLAHAFFKCAYLESWGRGIDLIREACAAHGAAAPVFRWDGGLWVEFPFGPEHVLPEALAEQGHLPTPQETNQQRPELGEKLGEKLGKTPAAIVALMAQNARISIRELAQRLQLSTTAIEKNIAQLKKAHLIQRVGPAKGGYWKVTLEE